MLDKKEVANMNINDAYDILDIISEKNEIDSNDLKTLVQLSQCDDPEIKAYVAELLAVAKGVEAEKTLIYLCNDSDELVRVNACDSLSTFPSENSYNCLIKRVLDDSSMLVKTYAILSIIDIIDYIKIDTNELKSLLNTNSNSKEISLCAVCYKGLYILGEDNQLGKLIELLNTDKYNDKCMVLNMLEDILTENNKDYILSSIKNLRKTESSIAVISVIDRMLKDNI